VLLWGRRLQEEEGQAMADTGRTFRKEVWKLNLKAFLAPFVFLQFRHWGGSTCVTFVSSDRALLEIVQSRESFLGAFLS